ncbi:MAG: hypothetical protein IID42_02970 [Planctomycetes bacterium]|nr:hypothetical protein [Planctomycetota bacterium]
MYNAVAADTDLNGNTFIDSAGEFPGLLLEDSQLNYLAANSPATAVALINVVYQNVSLVSGITVTLTPTSNGRTIAVLLAAPTPAALGNDTLVTIPSGLGQGSFATIVTNSASFSGPLGRDHGTIADVNMAGVQVAPWIIGVERTKGDLR